MLVPLCFMDCFGVVVFLYCFVHVVGERCCFDQWFV